MAIYFKTNNPNGLLLDFKKKIDNKNIVTWSYDSDGDFTHTPTQWNRSAWLRPRILTDKLALFIISPKGAILSVETYAVYHGRFIESMLAHCDSNFIEVISTSMPEGEDLISA